MLLLLRARGVGCSRGRFSVRQRVLAHCFSSSNQSHRIDTNKSTDRQNATSSNSENNGHSDRRQSARFLNARGVGVDSLFLLQLEFEQRNLRKSNLSIEEMMAILTPSARATIATIAEAPNGRAILDAIVKSRDPGLDWKLLLGRNRLLALAAVNLAFLLGIFAFCYALFVDDYREWRLHGQPIPFAEFARTHLSSGNVSSISFFATSKQSKRGTKIKAWLKKPDAVVDERKAPTAVLVSYDNGAFDHFVADCRAAEARGRGKGDAKTTAEEGVPIAFCPMEQRPSVTRVMLMVTALFGAYLVAIGACMCRPMVCARAIGELSRDLERRRKMPRG